MISDHVVPSNGATKDSQMILAQIFLIAKS